MIQEYLFTNTDHKKTFEQYKHEIIEIEICDIENSACWIVTFALSGENEDNAKLLSKVNEHITEKYQPTVLSNGCSAYFNKKLFPLFNEFERKLRKLLYMKSALSKKSKDNNPIKDLETKDLGEIFTILFSDADFVQNVRKSVNDKSWQFTKSEILNVLHKFTESTFWDNEIGKDAVSLLRSKFIEVKDFRNDVMHAHNVNYSSFNDARKLIESVNEQIDVEIGKIIGETESTANSSENSKDFNVALNDAIKGVQVSSDNLPWSVESIKLKTIEKVIEDVVNSSNMFRSLKEIERRNNSIDLSALQGIGPSLEQLTVANEHMQQNISKINSAISPALEELKRLSSSLDDKKLALLPALATLQDTLQTYKFDPSIEELSTKLKMLKRYDDDNKE